VEIRVSGRVQGVGFRPTIWRLARELELGGEVLNDAQGVVVRVRGQEKTVYAFLDRLKDAAPPLALIDRVDMQPFKGELPATFRISESASGAVQTQIAPDANICQACTEEVRNPFERRYRYPFTNCTQCGPRFSIVKRVPYDRGNTAMAPFALCAACLAEYNDPGNRRFHAEAIACHSCGPRATLIRFDGRPVSFEQHSMLDDVDAACSLIQKGELVAIKGLGGYQLACDATNAAAVARLRRAKQRDTKPFALMARDLHIIARYCAISVEEERQLTSAEGPIVLLRARGEERLPQEVAPGLATLGFMLPTTPLHVLLLLRMNRPVIMTSGNLSGEPQLIDDDEACENLQVAVSYALVHDRPIVNRVDDSVLRVMGGRARLFRRARGYAPAPLKLPEGFERAPDIIAAGGELKSTFCLVKNGEAVLSQHLGDLEDAATFDEYRNALCRYRRLFDHKTSAAVIDPHPDYLSSKLARDYAAPLSLRVFEVQHHHAHVAACLVENGCALDAAPVLGIALDGLGWGDDGSLWGGEFLLADYRNYERIATLKPVAMPGGTQAAREPWRNLYAHLTAEMGWPEFAMNFGHTELYVYLASKPRGTLDAMIKGGINSPSASSCGRLFDAVAAALGICRDRQDYEGEAAMRLEAIVCHTALRESDPELQYPIAIPRLGGSGLPYIEPVGMWRALLGDLVLNTPAPIIAARFHRWLAASLAAMARQLARRDSPDEPRFTTVALSGGCFQNCIIFEETERLLRQDDFTVLSHARVPANDGGLALGQAAVGAARLLDEAPSAQGRD